ncbi:MAG: hypothetical protein IT449_01555 [Phycisphaerales bacterium]|nr:hypothetical protein [Phycisphaerales bacterium]
MRSLDWLGISALPYSSRRNFLLEYKHMIPWTVLAGLVEGRFGSIVVSKTFAGSPTLVAIATATPTAAYIVSVYWGLLLAHAPKLRIQTLFIAGTALFAAMAGASPVSPWGAGCFILTLGLSQVFLAGVLTLRPAIWQMNYPSFARGKITAKLHAANLFVSTIVSLVVADVSDREPTAYRLIFPACAACGLLSLPWLWRMTVRGERRAWRLRKRATGRLAAQPGTAMRADTAMRATREARGAAVATVAASSRDAASSDATFGEEEAVFGLRGIRAALPELSPLRVSARMKKILTEDRRYSRYLTAQTFLGLSNLMVMAVLTVMVTREVNACGGNVYWVGTVLFVALPRLMMFGTLRQWGGLFDRVGVLRFRVINCWFWTVAAVLGLVGELAVTYREGLGPVYYPMMMASLGLQAIAYGLGMGGGKVAWSLGHLHFAEGAKGDVYMGIHVTLTGVRGTVATLLGVWVWWLLGWGVWLLALVFMAVATVLFARMAREEAGLRTEKLPIRQPEPVG